MKRYFRLTVFWIFLIHLSASATIINIPDDYETIQEGIDASSNGDTVLVQPGTYEEGINFNGHNIVLGSLFLTTGDTTYITGTVIDGNSSGTVVIFENGEDSLAVITGFTIRNGLSYNGGGIFCENNSCPQINRNIISENICYDGGGGIYCEESSPVISNNLITQNNAWYGVGIFCGINSSPTITGNTISENEVYNDGKGAGIYCWNQSSPIITNNIISDNHGDWGGGGIRCFEQSNAIIANNFISGNTSVEGGGINCEYSDPLIIDNTIQANIGWMTGAGIFCKNSDALIYNNDIKENRSYWSGGGIAFLQSDALIAYNNISGNFMVHHNDGTRGGGLYCGDSDLTIHNNVFSSNSAILGGGLYYFNSNLTFSNNTITENSADSAGGGIHCRPNTNSIITNTIFWSNSAAMDNEIHDGGSLIVITYSDIAGGWEGEGNIDVDPLFRDPDNGDFHLMSTACGDPNDSPCIDTGSPAIIDSLLDCSWGLGTILSDMGAYGGGDSATVGIMDNQPLVPDRFALLQNYPNPFNATTTISFSLPEPQQVTLTVYDLLGREVKTMVDKYRQSGVHTVTFDASDLASGMYFYKLQAGKSVGSRRMVLLK